MPPRREHPRAEHLRDLAWECQMLAGFAEDRGVRLDLLVLAQRFERLADIAQAEPWLPGVGTPARSTHRP
jgi:hypothetical protein